MTQKQSVVIIGGGPAGLTAAWEFVNNGGSDTYDVTVLEETQEFGGISRTVKHNGNRMDIGGHRFFSKDDRIMDWWKDVLHVAVSRSRFRCDTRLLVYGDGRIL